MLFRLVMNNSLQDELQVELRPSSMDHGPRPTTPGDSSMDRDIPRTTLHTSAEDHSGGTLRCEVLEVEDHGLFPEGNWSPSREG